MTLSIYISSFNSFTSSQIYGGFFDRYDAGHFSGEKTGKLFAFQKILNTYIAARASLDRRIRYVRRNLCHPANPFTDWDYLNEEETSTKGNI